MNPAHNLYTFSLSEIFTFFFIMLGPLKLIGPFASLTKANSEPERRALALRGIAIGTLTVIAAGFVGSAVLVKWDVSVGALAIAGGILFFRIAFALVVQPYVGSAPANVPAPLAPSSRVALQQLVPAIVSPYGVSAVILVMTIMPQSTLEVVVLLLVVMALDFVAMLFARQILAVLALPLEIVGSVMGVLQVALSVQMVVYGIQLIVAQRFGLH
jgi:multiple antibiotic resistance protein